MIWNGFKRKQENCHFNDWSYKKISDEKLYERTKRINITTYYEKATETMDSTCHPDREQPPV